MSLVLSREFQFLHIHTNVYFSSEAVLIHTHYNYRVYSFNKQTQWKGNEMFRKRQRICFALHLKCQWV